jgi:arylsulfatase A-like enzyme
VLVVTLDTTRVDRPSVYGYEHDTTPNLRLLAEDSVRYTRAYSTSSWTLPAHASLFTGKFPSGHGALYDPEGPMMLADAVTTPKSWPDYRARGLAAGETTLAEILAARGYDTGAVVAGPWLKGVFGLDQGFGDYDDSSLNRSGRRADEVTRAAVAWIERERSRPFFLFLNYFDSHGPYDPPRGYRSRFASGSRDPRQLDDSREERRVLYDSEIAFMDHELGLVLDRLRELGLYEGMWIVVTADHGEMLREQGRWGHGTTLSEAEIRIPLIVKQASATPRSRVDDTPLQLVDVLPPRHRVTEFDLARVRSEWT